MAMPAVYYTDADMGNNQIVTAVGYFYYFQDE
jgi:hypothetical protein